MRPVVRLVAAPCLAVVVLALSLPGPARCDDPAPDKVQIATLRPEDGYLRFGGTSRYPDGAVLGCEVRYFERLLPEAMAFCRVKKGAFSARLGPLPGKLLPGPYTALVRFVLEDQPPELIYEIQDDVDATYTSTLKVGTDEEIAAFEAKYREAVSGLLAAIDRRMRDMATAFAEASEEKRWRTSQGFDAEACISFAQGSEHGYLEDLRALDPFRDGAVPFQAALTERFVTLPDGLHLILCMHVKKAFREVGLAVPPQYAETDLDLPAEILEKQMIGEALQPIRDYLEPPKRDR